MPAPGTLSHTMNHVTGGHYFQPEAMMAPSMSTPTASLVSLAMLALDATAHTMGHIASSIPLLMPALFKPKLAGSAQSATELLK